MLAQETRTAVKSLLSPPLSCIHFFTVFACICNRVLFLLKESRKRSFIFDTTLNTNAVIVRLSCSERVRKREGEMDGWRGWKEL